MPALLHHILLLLTLRHDGSGLPRGTAPWLAIVVLCAAVALLRWGSAGPSLGMAAFLLTLALLGGKRLSAGAALISIGANAAVMALAFAGFDVGAFALGWEVGAYLVIVWRFHPALF
jgi:hypothetical protein